MLGMAAEMCNLKLGRLRWDDRGFKVSLGHIARPFSKRKKNIHKGQPKYCIDLVPTQLNKERLHVLEHFL